MNLLQIHEPGQTPLPHSDNAAVGIDLGTTHSVVALTFIMLIGVVLVADGLHFHIPKAYIYFSFAYACAIEGLNMLAQQKRNRK